MIFRCFFEQSGTFKNVFKEFGHNAFDYDILNDYGQTDYQIDLFKEIETEYNNISMGGVEHTIFTEMQPDKDFIMAFFPCTYFTDLNEMRFKGYKGGYIKEAITDKKNIERIIKRNKDRTINYELFVKFCFILQELKIPTIIENPRGLYDRNFLKLYSPFHISFTESDRSKFGDTKVKPTIYFAINFEMVEAFQMYDLEINTKSVHSEIFNARERSEITPRYARNFYKRFIENKI
jgi:hypothetical protein